MVSLVKPVPIFVCMGTAGCGKTSVAEEIQRRLGCVYLEGDVLHPKSNVDKMASGHPLDDDDRWPWLRLIRDRLVEESEKVKDMDSQEKSRAVVVTCSSLKKVYRDILRDIPAELATVTFVYLKGTPELLLERIQGRKGHFMPPAMLKSQLETLEEPNEETESVIVTSIVPATTVQAEYVLKTATERGLVAAAV